MDKLIRLKEAYNYLKGKGKLHTQKDVCIAMNADKNTVSQALNGNPLYLTDPFLERFSLAYPDLNINWLKTGEGNMLNSDNKSTQLENTNNADFIAIPREAWKVIEEQASCLKIKDESLKIKDQQMNDLIDLLKEQIKRGDDVGDQSHVAPQAAEG